jgi:hypothetical protein
MLPIADATSTKLKYAVNQLPAAALKAVMLHPCHLLSADIYKKAMMVLSWLYSITKHKSFTRIYSGREDYLLLLGSGGMDGDNHNTRYPGYFYVCKPCGDPYGRISDRYRCYRGDCSLCVSHYYPCVKSSTVLGILPVILKI